MEQQPRSSITRPKQNFIHSVQENLSKQFFTDPKGSDMDSSKMGEVNDDNVPSVSDKENGHQRKSSKKTLRIKVPTQPIKLKNYVDDTENFDVLHSHVESITNYVSIKTSF